MTSAVSRTGPDRFYLLRFAVLLGIVCLGAGLLGAVPLHAQVVDFEDGTIPSNWTEPTGSDAPWTITSSTAGSGTYSLGSNDIGDSETAEIEVTVEVPKDSVITFDYRVASEEGYDYFRFYVDGVKQLERSGDPGWLSSGEISVSAGTHTFRWAYEKDGSVSYYSDKAWIDNVALPTAPPSPPASLTAQVASVQDIQLDWSSTDGAEQYVIYRDTAPIDSSEGPSSYTALDTVDTGTSYLDGSASKGATYYYRVTTVGAGREGGFSKEASATPGLAATALQPRSGTPGTTVRITGKGFDPTASNNTVSFGGARATVTAAQPSALTVEVPTSTAAVTVPVIVETGTEQDTTGTRFQVLAENTGTRTFASTSLTGVSQSASAWGDLERGANEDNSVSSLDLVVAGGGTATLYKNDGSGTFSNPSDGLSGGSNGAATAWADYDNDQVLELVVAGGLSTAVYQWETDGSDTFTDILAGLEGVSQAAAAWGDVDNDGDPDLLVSGVNGSGDPSTTLYRNDGGDNFTTVTAGLPDLQDGALAWGDYNGDGLQDVAIAGSDGAAPVTQIYRNQGDGTFTAIGAGLTGVSAGAVRWADYDTDGDLDLLVTGDEGGGTGRTTLYRNDGGGTFTAVSAGLVDLFNSDADWGDYDGDGDPDLVLAGTAGSDTTAVLYQNDGLGDFTAVGAGLTGVTDGSVGWADQNNDGVLDLAVTGVDSSNTASARIYQSNAAPPLPPSGLAATAFADSVQLDWTAVGASDLAEYRIYRSTSPIDSTTGLGSGTALDTVSAGTTTYADASVAANTTYYYRVTAADDMGSESGASNQASGTTVFRLSGFEPASGTPTTAVRVFGNGFPSSGNSVTFLDGPNTDQSATITSTQDFALTVEVPSGLSGPTRIEVVRNDGTADTTAARFTPVGPSIGDRSFASIGAGLTGATEGAAAWGDYDDDGDLDLVVIGSDGSSPTATIYRNDGGSFSPVGAGLTGVSNGSADWGDYDDDGDLDLVITGSDGSTQTATIYRNDGGSFSPIGAGLSGVDLSSLDWGDYDNDGDLDLVVTGRDENLNPAATIYRNDGGGQFTAIGAGLSGVDRGSVDWGDYDGDGDLDLVVTGSDGSSPTATIYRNDGGSFSPIGAGLSGVDLGSSDWGDYDNDGDLDLVVTGRDESLNQTATIYRNDGGGQFTSIGAGLAGVEVGDLDWGDYDGDGDLDLVVTGNNSSTEPTTTVYRNEGGGVFTSIGAGLTGVEISSSSWGDYNADGALDLVVTGTGASGPVATVYQSQPEPQPPTGLSTVAFADSVRLDWSGVNATDLDAYRVYRSTTPIDSAAGPSGTSATEITMVEDSVTAYTDPSVGTDSLYYRVTAVDSSASESGFSNQAGEKPRFRTTGFEPTSGGPGSGVRLYSSGFAPSGSNTVSFFDTTGVNKTATVTSVTGAALTAEVPSGLGAPARIAVQRSDGRADTTAARFTPVGPGIGDRSFAAVTTIDSLGRGGVDWGDYDDDGDLDLAVAGLDEQSNNVAAVYRNDGGGTFTNINAGLDGVVFSSVEWGDYDNDGDLDLAVIGRNNGAQTAKIYQNQGGGTFAPIGAGLTGLDSGDLDWGDYDGDGDLDLVVTGDENGPDAGGEATTIYRNDGGGTFTAIGAGLPAADAGAIEWGDYDNDGDLDLALSGYDGSGPVSAIYRNDGGGTFTAIGAGLTDVDGSDLDWGDYDNDGNLDLVLSGDDGSSRVSEIYKNEGGGTFTTVGAGLTGVSLGAVQWGDYDGDGDLDLLLTGSTAAGPETTKIYRNDGGGTFSAIGAGLPGMENSSAHWGDYDADGALDIAVAGTQNGNLFTNVYRSRPEPIVPTGLSAAASADSIALDWSAVTATDLGKYRIYRETAAIDSAAGPSSLTPYDSVSAGTTSFADSSLTAGTTYYYRVTAVDTASNESGYSNEAIALYSGFVLAGVQPTSGTPGTTVRIAGNGFALPASNNTVSFLDTTGTAPSATVTAVDTTVLTVEVPSGLASPSRIAVQRSDGSADTTGVRFVPVGPGIGDRSFTDTGLSFTGAEESDAAWADYDDDGDLDVVITGDNFDQPSNGITTLYRNDDSTFTAVEAGLDNAGNSDVAWADYDNDGDPDLALMGGTTEGKTTTVYENKGGGTFEAVGLGLLGLEDGGIDWADYNGDGRPDLAVMGQASDGSETTKIYRNDGDTIFTAIDAGVVGGRDADLQWGDYNADGNPDLAVMGVDPDFARQTTIYRNDGGGTFTDIGAGLPGLRDGDLAWADYDNDGDLDLAVVGERSESSVTAIYENQGSDSFSPLNAGLTGVGDESALDWGDYDGDGRPDLIVVGQDDAFTKQTIVYRNQGGGTFAAVERGLPGAARGAADWADYDGDGALDLLLVGEFAEGEGGGQSAALFRSQPTPSAPPTLSAGPAEEGRTQLQWRSADATDIGRYRVYRDTAAITSSPSSLVPVDSVAAPGTTFTDPGVGPDTTYYYRVTAVDTTGAASAFSIEQSTTPKPAAGTLYVDPSASGANDGSSWPDAFVHLQDAADSVNTNRYTDYQIRVAEGVYYPDEDKDGDHAADDTTETFRITVDDVALLGGYPAGGGVRDPDAHRTVLSGDITQDDTDPDEDGVIASSADITGSNANTVLYLDGTDTQPGTEDLHSGTVIDGLTITGGQAEGIPSAYASQQAIAGVLGGGVFCAVNEAQDVSTCSPLLRDVTIRGNKASSAGGGVASYMGESAPSVAGTVSPAFRNVSFVNNRASGGDGQGGAVYLPVFGAMLDTVAVSGTADAHFVETTFRGNQASVGGAVSIRVGQGGKSRAQFVSSTFTGNGAVQGGAVRMTAENGGRLAPGFANVVFADNRAGSEAGAVYVSGSGGAEVTPTMVNATFVGNQADVVGGGVYSAAGDATVTPRFENTIFWANAAGSGNDHIVNNEVSPTVRHSLVEGSGGSDNWDTSLGTDGGGNIDTNPLFVDAGAADYRPQEDSPVLDAGLNSALPADATDLDADGDSTETLPLGLADSSRVVDDNGDATATVNVGAYEAVGPDRTALSPPDSVAITAFTDSLRIGWAAAAGGDLARYRIYRDTVGIDSTAGPASYAPIDSVGGGTTAYTDTSAAPDTTYHYRVTAVDEAGNESSFSPEGQSSPAAALTVWPGDTNDDGVVNQNDVLPLGFQWDQTGPARDSTGCTFEGRAAAAWPAQSATYADANGDGVVDQNDVLCIGLNWSDSTGTAQQAAALYAAAPATKKQTAGPDQPRVGRGEKIPAPKKESNDAGGRIELEAPTEPDSVLWVEVRAFSMGTVGGAAFEVTYPESKATVEAVEGEGWFGDEALFQSRVDDEKGLVGVGVVHPDSVRGGSGTLARLKVRLHEEATDAVSLQLRSVTAGRPSGTMVPLGSGTGVDVRRVPETFKLYGNYPNPARQSTTIRYDLPSERDVKLRVFDVLGRHVATLVDDTQKPGQKTVTWRADRMASGVYVYRLTAGDQSETGKITVVR